jgi:putative Mg2+ transporter-C (MgtC) family protein
MWEYFFQIGLAILLGGIVGFERERHHRPAGLKTHILVCLGACLLMMISVYVAEEFGGEPSRIAAQVVTGVGFLGAGTIIFAGGYVKGLTTAAGIWTVAGIGLGIGCRFYQPAIATTIFSYIILHLLDKISHKMVKSKYEQKLKVEIKDKKEILQTVVQKLQQRTEEMKKIGFEKRKETKTLLLTFYLNVHRKETFTTIINELFEIEGVRQAFWE